MPEAPAAIQAVVFDLDDTLFLERDYVRSGYRAVAQHLSGMGVADAAGAWRWLWQRFLAGRSEGALDALNVHMGLNLTAAEIAALVEVYRDHWPDIVPAGGAVEMLSRLRGQFHLALLSDGFLPAQELKLQVLQLRRFFDVVIFTESLGRAAWKPSPLGFEEIRRRFDLPHAALAYVADNPAKDFVAPNALGWLSVQYLRPGQIHAHKPAPAGGQPQALVRTPGELVEALLRRA